MKAWMSAGVLTALIVKGSKVMQELQSPHYGFGCWRVEIVKVNQAVAKGRGELEPLVCMR